MGGVIAVILGYLAWRWASDSGSWKKSGFLLLMRLGALAVAVWMLAGASTVTVKRDTKAKSVIFMVDSSASMGLVDPVDGSGETVRWTGLDTNSARSACRRAGRSDRHPAIRPLGRGPPAQVEREAATLVSMGKFSGTKSTT